MLPQKLWGAILPIGGRPIAMAFSLMFASSWSANDSLRFDGIYRTILSIDAAICMSGATLILLAVGAHAVIEVYRPPQAPPKRK